MTAFDICQSSVAEVYNFRGSCIDHNTFPVNTLFMHWDMPIQMSQTTKNRILTPSFNAYKLGD